MEGVQSAFVKDLEKLTTCLNISCSVQNSPNPTELPRNHVVTEVLAHLCSSWARDPGTTKQGHLLIALFSYCILLQQMEPNVTLKESKGRFLLTFWTSQGVWPGPFCRGLGEQRLGTFDLHGHHLWFDPDPTGASCSKQAGTKRKRFA